MTAQHDTDRLLQVFLREGPTEMSAPLAARIRGEVHETKQRAGFRPWRNLDMPRTFWVLAPLAAIVIAIGGLLVFNLGGPRPAPNPSPSPSTSASSIATQGAAASPTVVPTLGPTPYPLAPGEAWIVIGNGDDATLIRPDGTGAHEILGTSGLGISDPVWSPDGNELAFEGNGARGSQLWMVDVDGTNLRQLTPTPEGCPNGACAEAVNPAWSPDGRTIAYIAPVHSGGLFQRSVLMTIDVATGARTEIYSTEAAALARPTWSPDGKSIAIEVDRFVAAPESSAIKDTAIGIILLAALDHTPTMITDPALLAGYPVWHPTQDLIVFRTNRVDNGTGNMLDPAAASDIYTIRSDGAGLTRLTDNVAGGVVVRAPSWTAAGRILYTSLTSSTSPDILRIMDADGRNEGSATGAVTTQGQGRWRPGT